MDIIDLHTHTSASDGTFEPSCLVRHAHACGLSAVAITDHDTVDGVPKALAEGKRIGFKVIPGVEISLMFHKELHMLGYFNERDYEGIDAILRELRKNRDERNPKIIERLNAMGCDITMEDVRREAAGQVIGRPHIAKALVAGNYARDMVDAFDRFLSRSGAAYVSKEKLTPREGIEAISKCGGVPVLAHPSISFDSPDDMLDFVKEHAGMGLRGIEAYYPSNSEEQTSYYLNLAEEFGMIVTGGTDFHGDNRKEIKIGVAEGSFRVPAAILKQLEEAIKERYCSTWKSRNR